MTASSVNFADVLVAFGRYPTFEGYRQQLGIDFSGVVTAVGPDVTGHRVGDHVGGMSPNGCWSTFVTCDARHAVTVPPEVPLEDAAAVPTASATAWYGLHDLARISSADKVLIHSGTGGVGQAAIAIARAAGAEIFATAGSPQRRQLLHDMGIEHVYDSRSTEFAELIRRDTDGYGVDIVLNSLPGAAQRAGLELLAFGGRFIEIGKRDIYGDTRLGLFPFRRNLSMYAVDLALLTHSHPETVQRLLTTVYQRTADGTLPVPHTTHYPIGDAAAAVRLVGGAGHSGKVVLDIPREGRSVAVVPPEQARVFRPDGAYIITGGMGGLGLFLAAEMAAAGCGRIVLNARSAPSAEAQEAIERIRATGADVRVERGDIAEPGTAERLVAAATESGLPVRGVLHAAAVVEDATLTNVTEDIVDRCWAPKVYGAWNMHVACRSGGWPTAGLVLLVLVGRGTGGLAGPGRVRSGQQLARRVRPLASRPGASERRDRVGGVGAGRPRHGLRRGLRRRDHSRRGLRRVPCASPPRPHLLGLRPDHGDAVADGLRATQPVRGGLPGHGAEPGGHGQVPGRAGRTAPGGVAQHGSAAGLRPDQPAAAAHD